MQRKSFFRIGIFLTILFFITSPKILGASSLPTSQVSFPNKVVIPSINLNSTVLSLGKSSDGNMAVPSGKTNNVGWYKDGTIPGDIGSAVLDAHVFAAFSNLKKIKTGDDIYIINNQNQKLHFIVTSTKTYPIKTLTSETLFGQDGTRKLNLITCAGKLTSDKSTYDHRLIVSATYVDKTTSKEIARN